MLRDWLGEAKAKQIYLILRDRILTGAIAFGAKLPTENGLAEVHGMSRVTNRRALCELARLIERRRIPGMRVIYRPVAPMIADISGMRARLPDMGRRRAVKLTSFVYVPAEEAVAQALGVPPGQMLQGSVRVRSVDGKPFSFLTTYAPESIALTQQELPSRPFFDLIELAEVKVEDARPTHQRRVSCACRCRSAQRAFRHAERIHAGGSTVNPAVGSSTRTDRYAFEIDLVRSGTRHRSWSPIARQSREAGDRASTTRRLITRSKPPDLRAPR